MNKKLIILVGPPGSGKSTYARKLFESLDTASIINQDTLGNRKACINFAKISLVTDYVTIIDRCNHTKKQRAIWINLAKEYKVDQIECVVFNTHYKECITRVKTRKDHPTIKQNTSIDKIKQIVLKFKNEFEEVSREEGFTNITYLFPNESDVKANKSHGIRHRRKFDSFLDFFACSRIVLGRLFRF